MGAIAPTDEKELRGNRGEFGVKLLFIVVVLSVVVLSGARASYLYFPMHVTLCNNTNFDDLPNSYKAKIF